MLCCALQPGPPLFFFFFRTSCSPIGRTKMKSQRCAPGLRLSAPYSARDSGKTGSVWTQHLSAHVFAADPREMGLVVATTRRLWPKLRLAGKPEPLKEQFELSVSWFPVCVEVAFVVLLLLSVSAPVHSSYSNLLPQSGNRSAATSAYRECRRTNVRKEKWLHEGMNKWTDKQGKIMMRWNIKSYYCQLLPTCP